MRTPNLKILAAGVFMLVSNGGAAAAAEALRLAVTTSFRDSGLAAHLLPEFERRSGLRVDLVTVGSGMALEIARRGDVDALVAHAPVAELRFMAAGWGLLRQPVMYNYFLVLGPPPEQNRSYDAISLLRHIAGSAMPFVSRGDDSGTHKKEQSLWREAGISPQGQRWYLSVGQGMAAALQIADQKRAFVLADSGTWLALRGSLRLQVIVRDDELLKNPYHMIIVNPERHPHVNHKGAQQLLQFLLSDPGRQRIDSYVIDGEQAFQSAR